MFEKLLYAHNIDVANSTIHVVGEITEQTYKTVLYGISSMDYTKEITICLNTEGGDFYQALAIYDVLKFSDVNVKVVVCGPCMSAGVIILQAANDRVAMPNAQIMVHYGEDSNDSATTAKHNQEMLALMKNIIGQKTKVTKRTLNNWFAKDTYFNAHDALKAGLIDRIAK